MVVDHKLLFGNNFFGLLSTSPEAKASNLQSILKIPRINFDLDKFAL
jgi:hypothetical protein